MPIMGSLFWATEFPDVEATMGYQQRMRSAALLLLMLAVTAGCAAPPAAPTGAPPAAPPAPSGASSASSAPPTAAPPRVRIRSAYTSEAASDMALWAAHEAGLFAQEGLDVDVERIAGGTSKAMQVMVAGELDVLEGSGPAVVDAQLAGADVVSITTHTPVLGINIYAVPSIARVEDLRGQSLAITRAGTLSDFGARYALTRFGLRPETDVGLIQTGGNTETLATMQSGNVAAGVIASPFDVPARKLGYHEVLDLATLGLEFQMSGLEVQRAYLTRTEEPLHRFVRAYVAGIARVYQDKPFAKQVIAKYANTEDDEALESGYAAFGQRYLARVPYPTVAQFQAAIDYVAERDPRARDLRAESLIDDRFVRALDQDGFIASLYR
jgi:NitT/TauT family transport system substrate-binding protein